MISDWQKTGEKTWIRKAQTWSIMMQLNQEGKYECSLFLEESDFSIDDAKNEVEAKMNCMLRASKLIKDCMDEFNCTGRFHPSLKKQEPQEILEF